MDEGVAQLFVNQFNGRKIIGTVGQLQFEVIQYRLENEYTQSVLSGCGQRHSDYEGQPGKRGSQNRRELNSVILFSIEGPQSPSAYLKIAPASALR